MEPEPNNNASGSGNPKEEANLKVPSKDPKKKDDKKDEDLVSAQLFYPSIYILKMSDFLLLIVIVRGGFGVEAAIRAVC